MKPITVGGGELYC